VTYVLYFVHRHAGQSWESATRVMTEDPQPLAPHRLAEWDRFVVRARDLLGSDVEVQVADDRRTLTSERRGITVEAYGDAVRITARDASSEEAHDLVHRLGRLVVDETGLEGFDPQLQEPLETPGESISSDTPVADQIADLLSSDDLRRTMRDVERTVRDVLGRLGLK
jgi:hypothetical protein